jgi:hypothetical protein
LDAELAALVDEYGEPGEPMTQRANGRSNGPMGGDTPNGRMEADGPKTQRVNGPTEPTRLKRPRTHRGPRATQPNGPTEPMWGNRPAKGPTGSNGPQVPSRF